MLSFIFYVSLFSIIIALCQASNTKDIEIFNIMNGETKLKTFFLVDVQNGFFDSLRKAGTSFSCSNGEETLFSKMKMSKYYKEDYVICELKESNMVSEKEIEQDILHALQKRIVKIFMDIEFDKDHVINDVHVTTDNVHKISELLLFSDPKSIKPSSYILNLNRQCSTILERQCFFPQNSWRHFIIETQAMHSAKRLIILMDKDNEQTIHLFPLIKELLISGRCKCAGNSTRCQASLQNQKTSMKTKSLHCQCIDGWSGDKCDFCADGFQKKKIDNHNEIFLCEAMKHSRKRQKRQTCTCDRVGTVYGLCYPLPSHNYRCLCKRGYSGKFCNKCSAISYGYPNCKPCQCNIFGALVSKCDDVTGACRCRDRVSGRTCDQCSPGFYRYPICTACNCPKQRTKPGLCNAINGACMCDDKFDGESCQRCKDGYYNYPECKVCDCNLIGSNSSTCDLYNGQCECKEGFNGLKCNFCQNKNQKFPNCMIITKEDPKIDRKTNINCEQNGDCLFEKSEQQQQQQQKQQQQQHSRCKDLFFNDTESRISSCVPCGCFGEGTVSSVLKCNKINGQCPCKNNAESRSCDSCKNGFFNLRHDNIFGCDDCQCDSGGSINQRCDDDGNCKCKRNLAGKQCNRLQNGDYFLPDHYQTIFEMENSKLENGNPVLYRFSQAEFPHFTWKGYVAVGQEQSNLLLRIDVPKTSEYRILFRYAILSKFDCYAVVKMYKHPIKESPVFEKVIKFKVDTNMFLHGQYAESHDQTKAKLTKGQWALHVSSNSSGLFLDHVVLMPRAFSNPIKILQPRAKPCSFEMHRYAICSMFDYISLKNFKVIGSDAGFVADYRGKARASTFDDPDVMRQLNLKSLAGLSSIQPRISFNINSSESGKFGILVEYFVSDKKVNKIKVIEDSGKLVGHWMASYCPYKFLCRSVVLDFNNIPAIVKFKSKQMKTLSMILDNNGMLGIHSVTVVPYEEYTNEYIQPKFHCMMKKGSCLTYPRMPSLDNSIQLKNTRNITASDVNYEVPGRFSIFVKKEGWWVVVVQFCQPKYPRFIAQLTLKASSEMPIHRNVGIEFCPSQNGCRIKAAFYIRKGNLTVQISTPKEKEFSVDSVDMVPEEKFSEVEFNSDYVDVSAEYLRVCVDDNSMPIVNTLKSLCKNAFFSQLSSFNDGALSCNCHPRGSKNKKCNKNGGKCECKRNIIGRRCQSCRTGFYNFPYCQNCRCFMAGSLSPECDRYGNCKCKSEYGGMKCDRCKSSLFYAFPDCKPCNCDTSGSLSLFCDSPTGQCQCLINYKGRNCSQCQIGYHSFPNCFKCHCNAAGVIINKSQSNYCSPSQNGRCLCKKFVDGSLCDQCKDLYFNLQLANPNGCTPCKCDTAGTISGIATCDKNNGKCHCKLNVESRTCDTCKNGFFGLSKNHLFGCKACDCNKGGSTSHICDKKSGQCKCKSNITGRKCDRLISDSFFIPKIQHLTFDKKISYRLNEDKNKMNIQWKITIPKRSSYLLLFGYELQGDKDVNVSVSIIYSTYKVMVFQSRLAFKYSSSNSSAVQIIPLQRNKKDLFLTLHQGSYDVKCLMESSKLKLMYISLIPEDYLSGKSLQSTINDPCSVFYSSQPCIKYIYMKTQKNTMFSFELEAFRESGAILFNRLEYPLLNMNGAISLQPEQTFTFSLDQTTSGKFIFLFQYFYLHETSAKIMIHVQGPDGLQIGLTEFAQCPYIFTCRQIVLDKSSKVGQFLLKKGSKYHISISLMSVEHIALDLLTIIPVDEWNIDFLKPAEFCSSVNNKCIKSGFKFSTDFVILNSSESFRYRKPSIMPPNILDTSKKLLLLETKANPFQFTLRWKTSLKSGRFFVLLHYYQPMNKNIIAKTIIYTRFYSVAGMFNLSFCPHVSGCRSVLLLENFEFNAKQDVSLSGDTVGVRIRLPQNFKIWLDQLLFINTYEYEDNFLKEEFFKFSNNYQRTCIKNYNIDEKLTKKCMNWVFQIVLNFIDRPFNCNCKIEGSRKSSCSYFGGQCPCKAHLTGRTCFKCQYGYMKYPKCIKKSSKDIF